MRDSPGVIRDGPAAYLEDVFAADHRLCDLVDLPATITEVTELLGWNIAAYDAVAIITDAAANVLPDGGEEPRATAFGWHRDGGRMALEAGSPPARLAVKVASSSPTCPSRAGGTSRSSPAAMPGPRRHPTTPTPPGPSRHARRWIRSLQDLSFPRRWRRFGEVRRQLLGEERGSYGRFFPDDADVPLRTWAQEPGIDTPA